MKFAVVVAVLALFLSACGGSQSPVMRATVTTDPTLYTEGRQTATAAAAPRTHTVTYKVARSTVAGDMSLTYENAQGGTEQVSSGSLMWEQSFNMEPGSFVYISAQNPADHGDISCDIIVDGASFKHSQSSGAYVITDCSGSVGR